MNISIVKEKSTYIATVTFDAQEWKNAQDKAYANLAQNVTVQGFRKGKAPLELAKKHIDGRKMVEKAVDILLPLGNQKVLEENNFELLLRPELDVKEVSDDKVVVEYYYVTRPEVTLGQYKDLEIAKDSVEVTDEDVENELKALQQKNVELQVKEGEIALGDTANIDFKGFVNGVAFEGGEAKGYDLEIGSGAFIPGFEEQLVGAKEGQDLDINVTFPEQYSKELAGKPAVFKIHVNSVKEKVVPEINDDLALDANIEGVSNLEELKEHLRKTVSSKKEQEADNNAFTKLLDTIFDASEVEVPERAALEEAKSQLENFKQQVAQRGIPYDKYLEITGATEESLLENMKNDSNKNLKASFVLQEVAKVENVNVTQEDIENEFQTIADQYKMDLETVKKALGSRVNELANQIYQRKVLTFLREANKIA
jgi:trigger factor